MPKKIIQRPVSHQEFIKRFLAEKVRFNQVREKAIASFKSCGAARVSPSIYDVISVQTERNWIDGRNQPSKENTDGLRSIGFGIDACLYDFS